MDRPSSSSEAYLSTQLPLQLQRFSLLSKLNLLLCNECPLLLILFGHITGKNYSLPPTASFPLQLTHSFSVFSSFYFLLLLPATFSQQLMNLSSSLPLSLADLYSSRAVAPKTSIHLFYWYGWADASFIIHQILSCSYSCYSMSLPCAQPGRNCSAWTLLCRTALVWQYCIIRRPEPLTTELIFPCHRFSSSRQVKTRALSFCRLPAPPVFLFSIYSFVLITNKSTEQHQMVGRTLQNSSW